MIAVIAGSTGLVGSLLISKLLADKSIIQVISVTRKSLGYNHIKLKEVIVADFSNLLAHKLELFGDVYFCALGTTIKVAGSKENFKKIDYDAIVDFGKIAEHHHAKSFIVVSASMADASSSVFYNKVKGETEQTLMLLNLNRLVVLRPGLLIGKRDQKRIGEKFAINLINLLSPILPSRVEKSMATTVESLAARMHEEGHLRGLGIKKIESVDI